MPGNLYMNVLMSTFAEISAKPVTLVSMSKQGVKKSFFIAYSLAVFGVILILITNSGDTHNSRVLLAMCLFIAKLGVAMTFMVNYLSI